MSDFLYRHRHKISVELDSTNFCTGHDVPPAKYSLHHLLKLKPRLFSQPVGWVETVRVRRPRASAFYQLQLFAKPSDRPTRGPVDLLKQKTFRRPIFTNAGIWSAAVCDVWVRSPNFGVRGDYFLLPWQDLWQGGGKVVTRLVARWWLLHFARVPQLPHPHPVRWTRRHTPILTPPETK